MNQHSVCSEKDRPRFLIVHWNRPMECLATIRSSLAQIPRLHILVLDNNSSVANFEALRGRIDSSVEILRFDENKGWGPALNIPLRKWLSDQTAPYCFISAHDAELAPDCLTRLKRAMDADPKLGIACPRYPDCSVPHLSPLHGVSYKFGSPPPADVESIDVPHGTLMIVRRECLADIGLFDERYFAYGDEHELGARARRHGWKVGLVWGAIVANPGTSTTNRCSYFFTRNSLLFVHDYFGKWAAWLRALIILINMVRLPRRNSIRARWRGCRDYFANRFGSPRFS